MREVQATYDDDTRAAYIYLFPAPVEDEGAVARSVSLHGSDVILDYDAKGNLLGIEVLLGRED